MFSLSAVPPKALACDDNSVATNCVTARETLFAEVLQEHALSGDMPHSSAKDPGDPATAATNTPDHPPTHELEQTRQLLPEAEDDHVAHQSSAERNIWSVFNPLWGSFRVNQPRLPRPSDAGVNWARTVGQPEEMKKFLGLKNPVNRA